MGGQLSNCVNMDVSRLGGSSRALAALFHCKLTAVCIIPIRKFPRNCNVSSFATTHLGESASCHLPWVPQDCPLLLWPLRHNHEDSYRINFLS